MLAEKLVIVGITFEPDLKIWTAPTKREVTSPKTWMVDSMMLLKEVIRVYSSDELDKAPVSFKEAAEDEFIGYAAECKTDSEHAEFIPHSGHMVWEDVLDWMKRNSMIWAWQIGFISTEAVETALCYEPEDIPQQSQDFKDQATDLISVAELDYPWVGDDMYQWMAKYNLVYVPDLFRYLHHEPQSKTVR